MDDGLEVLLRRQPADVEDAQRAGAKRCAGRNEELGVHAIREQLDARGEPRRRGAELLGRRENCGRVVQSSLLDARLERALEAAHEPRRGELRVPEAIGGHIRNAETFGGSPGRDGPRDLKNAQGPAAAELIRVRPGHGQGTSPAAHGLRGREHAHAPEERRIARELLEGLRQVAEVEHLAEGIGVRPHVAVEEARELAGLGEGPDPAPEGGKKPDGHARRFLATTRKPVLSSGRRTAASLFQRLSLS